MLAFVVIRSLLETLLTSQLHILGGCKEFNGPRIWGRYTNAHASDLHNKDDVSSACFGEGLMFELGIWVEYSRGERGVVWYVLTCTHAHELNWAKGARLWVVHVVADLIQVRPPRSSAATSSLVVGVSTKTGYPSRDHRGRVQGGSRA